MKLHGLLISLVICIVPALEGALSFDKVRSWDYIRNAVQLSRSGDGSLSGTPINSLGRSVHARLSCSSDGVSNSTESSPGSPNISRSGGYGPHRILLSSEGGVASLSHLDGNYVTVSLQGSAAMYYIHAAEDEDEDEKEEGEGEKKSDYAKTSSTTPNMEGIIELCRPNEVEIFKTKLALSDGDIVVLVGEKTSLDLVRKLMEVYLEAAKSSSRTLREFAENHFATGYFTVATIKSKEL